jgi:tetratricopeptide (TPR) repeat protein
VEGALAEARAAILKKPDQVEAHEIVVDILVNRGMGATARSAYTQLTRDNPQAAWAWVLLGRASQNPVSALEAYGKALELDPAQARAWAGRGDVHRALGETEDAREAYETAIAVDSTLARAYTGLGALLLQEGRLQDALATCELAIVSAPGDPEAYLAAAQLAPERAQDFLVKGAQAVPDDVRLHTALGRVHLEQGNLPAASVSFGKAQAVWPHHPDSARALYMIGCMERGELDSQGRISLERAMLLGQEMPVAALDLLTTLASQAPRCSMVLAGLGLQQYQAGQVDSAETSLLSALEAAKPDPGATSWIQGSLGMLYASEGGHANALPLLEAATASRTRDVDLAVAGGVARAHVEGPAAGARDLDQVARRFPGDPRPIMALAAVLTSNGDAQAAYTVLKRANAAHLDPTLLLALAGAARDAGDKAAAAQALRDLSVMTADPTWSQAADRLNAGN